MCKNKSFVLFPAQMCLNSMICVCVYQIRFVLFCVPAYTEIHMCNTNAVKNLPKPRYILSQHSSQHNVIVHRIRLRLCTKTVI